MGEIELAQSIRALLETPFDKVAARRGDAETDSSQSHAFQDLKRSLSVLSESRSAFPKALQPSLAAFNGKAGDARSFDRLDGLIRKQHYRLVFWRAGSSEINYRRFFDITDLAAVKMEVPEVFEASHQLIQRLMFERRITGLRIDHPDGLWNPAHYFRRLQACFLIQSHRQSNPEESQSPEIRCAASDWLQERASGNEQAELNWPFYVVAEKILSEGEDLPRDWTLHGTTGYETLILINSLFVRQASEQDFDRIYSQFIGRTSDYHEQVRENKRRILETSLSSELNALARLLKKLASETRHGCDLTSAQLLSALTDLLAAFPVYRSYVTEETCALSEADKAVIGKAMADATVRNAPDVSAAFTFLSDTLLLHPLAPNSKDVRRRQIEFIMRFQQLTGPAMAKGLEDTTFYRYNRLVSLNEVGGHPNRFGISLSEFHACNSQRQATWPNSLTATATHDTKRGEDVRARINVLSEIPDEWEEALIRWRSFNSARKGSSKGNTAPDENDEYLFYQILTGVWPSDPCADDDIVAIKDRVTAYMLKASKEAKVHTSWTDTNAEYEEAVCAFVSGALDSSPENRFLADFVQFQKRIAFFGAINSLAQTLLKITVPGIPDFYQGTELWDLSLVDPDNRRPVDYQMRRRMLTEIENKASESSSERAAFVSKLLTDWRTGQVKQYLIHAALQFRRQHSQLFARGQYQGLNATGSKSENVCAFARVDESKTVVVVVPRLIASLADKSEHLPIGDRVWGDTRIEMPQEIPAAQFRNALTGETVDLDSPDGGQTILMSQALRSFPVALLESSSKNLSEESETT